MLKKWPDIKDNKHILELNGGYYTWIILRMSRNNRQACAVMRNLHLLYGFLGMGHKIDSPTVLSINEYTPFEK